MINIGDKVQSKITGAIGIVISKNNDNCFKVLETVNPIFTSNYSSENALILIEKNFINIVNKLIKEEAIYD